MTIKATNDNLWIRKFAAKRERGGIAIPDSAQPKTNKGLFVTVGKLTTDPDMKAGRVAIFNRSAGFEIEENGVTYLILRQIDVVGTDDYKNEQL
jgi:chaperonin GroES